MSDNTIQACDTHGRQYESVSTVGHASDNLGKCSAYVLQSKLIRKFPEDVDNILRAFNTADNVAVVDMSDQLLAFDNCDDVIRLMIQKRVYAKYKSQRSRTR